MGHAADRVGNYLLPPAVRASRAATRKTDIIYISYQLVLILDGTMDDQ
jgi:hypothetical protein